MERTDMHRLQELVRLHRQGIGAREVARLLGMSPNTERTYRLALGLAGLLQGDPGLEHLPDLAVLREGVLAQVPVKTPLQQVSSLEGLADKVFEMAKRGAKPKAIFDKLVLDDPDFKGSVSAVKRLWRRWKKDRGVQAEDVAIPVDTLPGDVAQVDFGYVGMLVDPATRKLRRAWVFTMVLGYSRHLFAKIVFDQRAETWVQLHIEAFAELGGVPRTIVPDNLKAAVIRAAFGVEREDSGLNRTYCELARHYTFLVDPAPPFAPKKKGKVESGVRYVKSNFFKPRAFEHAEEAQAELRRWRMEIAGQRDHGTTHRKPLEVFEQEERATLEPLPPRPYVPIIWKRATVHSNSHLVFGRREYSVPWTLCHKRLWVRATPDTVYIHDLEEERVATHDRRGPGPRSTNDAHLPEHRRDLRHRDRAYWVTRAKTMGDTVGDYIVEVFGSEDVISKLRVVQAIVTHLEKHPSERAVAACERARHFGNHTYKGVRDILRQGLDYEPLPQPLFATKTSPRPQFSRAPNIH
ncbi:MAG: IS21 family transposase [Actinobacteria bacterium]|nr:IS21 family transposase [Actinomycetota bacterium]